MNRNIQYSIIEHLRQSLGVPVEWERDGLDITNYPKPFITVFGIFEESELLAAGREDFEEIFRYQITLRANSTDELEIMRTQFKEAMREKVALYDLSVQPFAVTRFFVVDIDEFNLLLAEDEAREVDHHRLHADVSVQTFFDTGTNTFTQ
jgi:hypothetical protein